MIMGKYKLVAKGINADVEADFLPGIGQNYLNGGTIYYVQKIIHEVVQKEGGLEAKVEVHLKLIK